MKSSIFVMAAILLMGIGTAHAAGQTSRWLTPDDPTAKLITVVETMWADAACGPQPAALKDAIADDFQGTSTKGERYPQSEAVDVGHDRDCQLQSIHIRQFDASLATACGPAASPMPMMRRSSRNSRRSVS